MNFLLRNERVSPRRNYRSGIMPLVAPKPILNSPSFVKRTFSECPPDCGFDRPKQSNIDGTVHFHKRHIFLCSGTTEWPSNILTMEPYKSFQESLSKVNNSGIKYSATNEPSSTSSSPENLDWLIFPEKIRISNVPKQHFDSLCQWSSSQMLNTSIPKSLGLHVECFHSSHVFICSHGSKDSRCGYCGPILVDQLQALLKKEASPSTNIQVHHVSHIGGHAFAGNLIIFGRESTGDYLGNITPTELPSISQALIRDYEKTNDNFHTIIGDFKLWKFWRGKLGWTQEEQKTWMDYARKVYF